MIKRTREKRYYAVVEIATGRVEYEGTNAAKCAAALEPGRVFGISRMDQVRATGYALLDAEDYRRLGYKCPWTFEPGEGWKCSSLSLHS